MFEQIDNQSAAKRRRLTRKHSYTTVTCPSTTAANASSHLSRTHLHRLVVLVLVVPVLAQNLTSPSDTSISTFFWTTQRDWMDIGCR